MGRSAGMASGGAPGPPWRNPVPARALVLPPRTIP